ncbi:MAG: hypothetical protein ACFFE5_03120 [Candidatus Thorarchaeota archaeon]
MIYLGRTIKVQVICPTCKKSGVVGIPPSGINKKSQLTTISVHKGLICPHHFQFFMDTNFKIRGYQKVDLELIQENSRELRNGVKAFSINERNRCSHFRNLILEGEQVKFRPLTSQKNVENQSSNQYAIKSSKKMSSKEIYEEFWEFIDDTNEFFLDFIVNDKRRTKHQIASKINKGMTIQN